MAAQVAFASPSKGGVQLPDDIRIRYIYHSDSVKQQVVAIFSEQTNWLVDHIEAIRKTYGGNKKTAGGKKGQKKGGRKAAKGANDDARPALTELMKSPRKKATSQPPAARVPQVVIPKLTLASADPNIQRQRTPDPFGPVPAASGSKATSSANENGVPEGSARSRKPASSAKADKSRPAAPPRSPLSPLSPRRTPNPLSPTSEVNTLAAALASGRALAASPVRAPVQPAPKAPVVHPAEQTAHDLSAIAEEEDVASPRKTSAEESPILEVESAPVVGESPAEVEEAMPDADEDEAVPRPPSAEPPVSSTSTTTADPAKDVEMAVPLNDNPSSLRSAPANANTSLSSSTHRTPGQKSSTSIFPGPSTTGSRKPLLASSTANAALPPSPSSAFLGKMGLGLGRNLGAPATLPMQLSATTVATTNTASSRASLASAVFSSQGTGVTSATSLGSQMSPPAQLALPTLGGVFGMPSVNGLGLKRTSAAAELPTAGSKDAKVSRVDGTTATATSGATRLESVKEALVKMRTQRNSTMGASSLLRTSHLDVLPPLPRTSIAPVSLSASAAAPVAATAPSSSATAPAIVTARPTEPAAAPVVSAPQHMEVEAPKEPTIVRDSQGSSITSDLLLFPAPPSSSAALAPAPIEAPFKESTPHPSLGSNPLAPEPAPPAEEPRRISALPKRVSGGLRKKSSVGDLVAQFEKRRESIEAEQAVVAPGRRLSTPPATVVAQQPQAEIVRRPSPLASASAVAPPHPTTTPPGSPPTMHHSRQDQTVNATRMEIEADADGEEDVLETGFDDEMIIEDSMAQLDDDANREDLVDGTDVIETRPIDFFADDEDEPERRNADDMETGVVGDVEDFTQATQQTVEYTAPLKTTGGSRPLPKGSFAQSEASYTTQSFKGKSRADENTTAEMPRKPTLKKVPSNASLASTKSQGGGLTGLLSKAGSVLTTTWGAGPKGKPEVKSLQLAAAAAKKEQEEKERRAAIKEERRLAMEKKQAEDRAKSEEAQKVRAADAERRRKEELAKRAAMKPKLPMSRQVSEEPKKRKVEAESRSFIDPKKPKGPADTSVAGPSFSKPSASASYQPSRPAPSAPSAIKPSAAAAAAVGTKTMTDSIRLVGQPGKPKPVSNWPSSATKTPVASTSNAMRHFQPQGLSVHPSQVYPQPAAAAAPPKPAVVATPEQYIELPDIDSEYSDDDEEEQERKNAALPQWAQSPYLREALDAQAQIDPADIFGPIPDLKMEELFKSKSGRFRMRTSSANWAGTDGLTAYEEAEYARRMGYRSAQASKQQQR